MDDTEMDEAELRTARYESRIAGEIAGETPDNAVGDVIARCDLWRELPPEAGTADAPVWGPTIRSCPIHPNTAVMGRYRNDRVEYACEACITGVIVPIYTGPWLDEADRPLSPVMYAAAVAAMEKNGMQVKQEER